MPEKLLLKALCARKQEAYEILLDRYEAGLYRFFYYSHGNHQLAEDQCGETFATMIEAVRKMKSNKTNSLKPFLFGIARNVMRRSWRKSKLPRGKKIALDGLIDPCPSPFRKVATREQVAHALKAIEQFPDRQRQILLLRFVETFKLEEIAEVMDMPVNSVKSHVHRGRKKICQILNIPPSHNSESKNEKQNTS